MKILFMGTPDFAAVALSAICDAGENVIGVITLPDRPVGRGYKLTPSAVKVCALERNIPVYQPTTLKSEEFADFLKEIDPELIIVAAYGKILPKNVLDYPKYGCINIHGSLLPEYRGAAPMQRAIIDGKPFTGITTMMMDVGLDTGDILLTERVDILPEDNFETIHDKMAAVGGSLMLKTIEAIRHAEANPDSVKPLQYAKPITMRVELVERGILPSSYAKPYMKIIDGRTYEVTGDTMEEVLFRA